MNRQYVKKLRKLLKKSYSIACGYYLYNNLKISFRLRMGKIESHSGTTHVDKDISSSLAYIDEVFADYKYYGGIRQFYGRVAEIGPGDNCGVGLLFLRDGCDSVDLVDRFYTMRNSQQQTDINRSLISRDALLREKFHHVNRYEDNSFNGITRFYGEEASAEIFFLTHDNYDFIISRAVLEHVYNPTVALTRMASALAPDGMMLHKVDLGDHGMFSSNFHELKFYEVSDWLYQRMTKSAGYPNRVLSNQYDAILRKTQLNYSFLITHLAGVGEIKPHVPYQAISDSLRRESLKYVKSVRKRFTASIASISDENLSITGFFLIAKKGKN